MKFIFVKNVFEITLKLACGALLLVLTLQFQQVKAQSCSPTEVNVDHLSCSTSNDGAISVTPKPCGNQEVCYTGTPTPVTDCTTCSKNYSGQNLVVELAEGQKICITGSNTSVREIRLNGSGTVVVCGTATFSNWINFDKAVTLVVLGTATVVGGINLQHASSKIHNYGTLKLTGGGASINGELVNYGTLEVNGDVNINNGTARLDNYKMLTVKNSLNSAETLNNWGTINIGTAGAWSKMQFNSSSRILNACTINVTGDALFDAGSVFDHRGRLTISKDTYINGNSVVQLMGGTKIQTKGNLTSNSGVISRAGGIGCSLFETTGYSTFNSGSLLKGNIAYCARGGRSADPPREDGAVLSCTSCSPPANPPREIVSISWTGPEGTSYSGQHISNLAPGDYHMSLECGDCSYSNTYTITAPPPLSVTVKLSEDQKSATASAAGGEAPYHYQWSGPVAGSGEVLNNLLPGTYTVTATDAKGCEASAILENSPTNCHPVVHQTPISCFGANDGQISIVDAGCSDAEILWLDLGTTSPSITNLGPGTYRAHISCSDVCSEVISLTLVEPQPLVLSITSLDDEVKALSAQGGTGPYVYGWYLDNVLLSSNSTSQGLPSGTYQARVSDGNGCEINETVTITTSHHGCSPDVRVSDITCQTLNGKIEVNPSSTCESAVIVWTNTSGHVVATGPTLIASAGEYTLTLLCEDCAFSNKYVINAAPPLTVSAETTGITATALVTGGTMPYMYQWTVEGRLVSTDASPEMLPGGVVTLTVIDFNGCLTQTTVTTNTPACNPDAILTSVSCSGAEDGAITITSLGCLDCNCGGPESVEEITYSWYGINAQGNTANNLAQGTYTVAVYCKGSCYSLESYDVTAPPVLLVDASVDDLGQVTSTVSGGVPFSSGEPYTYTWTSAVDITVPSILDPVLPVPGSYTLTVTDSVNCSANTIVTWRTPPCPNVPTVTIKPSSCGSAGDGKITVVTSQCSSGDQVAYFWTGPGVTDTNRQSASLDKLTAGTYTLTMTCGVSCTSTFEYEVPSENAINIQSIAVTKSLSCNQAFDGALSVLVNGGSGAYDYEWSDSWKTIGTNAPDISGLTAGVYHIKVTDKNGESGCIGEGSVTLNEPGEECSVCTNGEMKKKDLVCADVPDGSLEVKMKDSGTYIYQWSSGQTSPKITGLDAGIYVVEITNTFNGDKCSMRSFIQEPEEFAVNIQMEGGPEICSGEAVRLEAVSAAPVVYSWNGSNPLGVNSPVLVAFHPGTYTVTATWGSCSRTASVTLYSAAANQCTDCDISATLSSTPLTCYLSSDGKAEVLATGGSGNYTYVWNNGDVGRRLENVPAGTYQVSVTDRDGESCSIVETVKIDQPDAMQISVQGGPVICHASSTTLSAVGSPGSYTWTKVGTNETFPNQQTIVVATGGTYQVEVRSENGLCTARSQEFTIRQQEAPTIARMKSKLCPGESLELSASQSQDITWSTGETTQEITVSQPGTYTVSSRPGNCDAMSETITVTLKSPEECEEPNLCEPTFAIPVVLENPCVQETINRAEQRARERWEEYVDHQRKDFQQQYIAQCLQTQEELTMKYNEQEHHYTLFYYDQSGNLVRTVPPKGVKPIVDPALLNKIKQERASGVERTVETSHTYMTTYRYNSNNQSVGLIMPDHKPMGNNEKISQRQWYDELGRVVLSQTSYHYAQNPKRYQYVIYDKLGREIENGEVRSNVDIATVEKPGFSNRVETDKLKNWIAALRKYEVHRNFYDSATFSVPNFYQQYLRNRLASATYEMDDSDGDFATYDNAIHYSYDVHGNVKEQVTDYPELDHLASRYKSLSYVYDLVSQNVLEMHYQKGHLDQYFYRNEYDADNRLVQTWTSRDYIHWDRDAKQFFYDHGPLARTEIGHDKVQGVDYAYTIHGWIKGVNSNTLMADRDMGKDGHTGTLHQNIPKDEMGYSLGFYNGDYSPVGDNRFLINTEESELETANRDLFNGNISNLITSINEFMKNGQGPLAQTFKYDQLNRLTESRAYEDPTSVNSNRWSPSGTATHKYMTRYTYDANGNILTLKRNAHVGTTSEGDGLDDLIYEYENNTNRLMSVEEQRDNSNHPELEELDDIKP